MPRLLDLADMVGHFRGFVDEFGLALCHQTVVPECGLSVMIVDCAFDHSFKIANFGHQINALQDFFHSLF
jgi:hypothetical protein